MNTPLTNKAPSSLLRRFDVCVIGHVTRDIIRIGETRKETQGGTAFYTSIALRRLGLEVGVLTKAAEKDRSFLLHELEKENIKVLCGESESTTTFGNAYIDKNAGTRVQQIKAIGTPFSSGDLEGIEATACHVGPLTDQDVSVDFLRQLKAKVAVVSLDVQGMLRRACLGRVSEKDWPEKHAAVPFVDILKADEKEARVLSGEKDPETAATALASLGPKEVIVTMERRGSIVRAGGSSHRVPSFKPHRQGDPTGDGDTYMAGYLYQRLRGAPPEQAGMFAAAMATLKLEGNGPFRGSEEEVYERLRESDSSA